MKLTPKVTKLNIEVDLEHTAEDKTRPVKFSDLRPGMIFTWEVGSCPWSSRLFLMLDPNLSGSGQVFNLTENDLTWFSPYDPNLVFRVFETAKLSVSDPVERVDTGE
jgi:hypothetical protein